MLKFNENGKYRILLFGDIHENIDYLDKNKQKFLDMHKLMNAALDEYKPDLCVLLGDNFNSGICKENPELFKKGLKDLCEPIFRRNIKVAAIMGNHEHDHDCDAELVKCYTECGIYMRNDDPETGDNADYLEILYSNDGKTPKAALWFLDSNNLYEDKSISNYDVVHKDQIEWFNKKSDEIKFNGSYLPGYVFQHIPVIEEYKLLRKAKWYHFPVFHRGYNSHKGTIYVKAKGTKGYFGEGPCSPDIQDGQFDSWKSHGIKAAFFGHDHLNDFSGFVDGIFLAQHKTAGFRAYTDGCRSCVRLLELDENNPDTFFEELKHFKEFGLKCECLGFAFKHFTDRESLILNILLKGGGAVAGLSLLIYVILHFMGV